MKRDAVTSSVILSIGYSSSIKTLEIEFIDHHIYQYHPVLSDVYKNLMSADSHGKYFNSYIKDHYPFTRIQQHRPAILYGRRYSIFFSVLPSSCRLLFASLFCRRKGQWIAFHSFFLVMSGGSNRSPHNDKWLQGHCQRRNQIGFWFQSEHLPLSRQSDILFYWKRTLSCPYGCYSIHPGSQKSFIPFY